MVNVPGFPAHLSKKGAHFIGAFEGLRLEPYNDAVNNATIGYGHLLHYGPVTTADRKHWAGFTTAAALKLLQVDAERFAGCVRAVPPRIRNQARFDACVSLAFNCGPGVLSPYSAFGAELRKPARGNTANAFLLYDHAGGIVLEGLRRRRLAERHLWLTDDYSWA